MLNINFLIHRIDKVENLLTIVNGLALRALLCTIFDISCLHLTIQFCACFTSKGIRQ